MKPKIFPLRIKPIAGSYRERHNNMASLAGAARGLVRLSAMHVLFIHLLLLLVVSSVTSGEDKMPKCTAVTRDQAAWVTCFFPENVNATKAGVTIQRYPLNNPVNDPTTVVSCGWDYAEQWNCTVDVGYSVDGSVSTTLTVEIPKPTVDEEGKYICLLVPSTEQAEPCVLTVATKPTPPYNLSIVAITEDSITVRWMAGESEILPQKFMVRYKKAAAGEARYKFEEVCPNNTIYTITDLWSSTEYEISVMAKNSRGDSGYQKKSVVGKTEGSSSNQSECGSSDPNGYLAPFIAVLVLLVCFLCLFALFFIYRKCRDNGGNHVARNEPGNHVMDPLRGQNAP